MKKNLFTVIFVMLFVGLLAGCGNSQTPNASGKIQVVTTIFPEYDWVKEIVGDNDDVEISMLLDNGADLHSYQPTANDILKISTCDLFIYVGGESDEWVDDALNEAVNKDMVVLNLMDIMGDDAKEEEVKEGMEAEEHEHEDADHEDADHEDADHEDADHEEEVEYDEHVWLSLKNASIICNKISDALCKIDSANADSYKANLETYTAKLNDLDASYKEVVDSAQTKTLLFGDRFPFRYLTDDYGLDYFAAFVGCSAETEASFETVMFLANKVDELSLKYVCTIENSDGKIAETIIQNTKSKDAKVLKLNSMQSVNATDVENGASYYNIMNENLEALKTALN
ncbi:MAG: metal ABC transporter substrate-binding protein [Parasporobacterium sp.]|nr:metal ABC transporter substrate-binding protein [Parasporobacterium sp.]